MRKYFVLILCLLLSSCFSTPCKINLEVHNNSDEIVEVEISNNYYNHSIYYKLNPYDNIKIKNREIKYTNGIILIKTSSRLKGLGFGEYDHWFPTTHNLSINIDSDEINIFTDRMATRIFANNYEEYKKIMEQE